MNGVKFTELVDDTVQEIIRLLELKGGEYASNDDRLANFKRGAELTGCTPLQIGFIYASKHYDAIASYVRNPNRPSSEPIEGRFDDLINYCILMKGLVAEARNASAPAPTPNEQKVAPYHPGQPHLIHHS